MPRARAGAFAHSVWLRLTEPGQATDSIIMIIIIMIIMMMSHTAGAMISDLFYESGPVHRTLGSDVTVAAAGGPTRRVPPGPAGNA